MVCFSCSLFSLPPFPLSLPPSFPSSLPSLPYPCPLLPTPTEEGSAYEGMHSFATQDTDLFNRTFTRKDYFYCERCKKFNFNHSDETQDSNSAFSHPCFSSNHSNSKTLCSNVEMAKAVIYPGNIFADKPNSEF